MMKIKTILKALSIKAGQRLLLNKGLAKSYVSLFLVLVLGVTSSMAWFTAREAAELNSGDLEFQSASSLRINKDKYSANKIEIPAFTLDEASSLDGRNIYFPVDKSFTSNTAEMFFREGNRGDENVHYVYKDFELKGTSGNTPVYIKSYKIQVGSNIYEDQLKVVDSNGDTISEGKIPDHQVLPKDHCPVRLAFIADSGVKPVVIDPNQGDEQFTKYLSGPELERYLDFAQPFVTAYLSYISGAGDSGVRLAESGGSFARPVAETWSLAQDAQESVPPDDGAGSQADGGPQLSGQSHVPAPLSLESG